MRPAHMHAVGCTFAYGRKKCGPVSSTQNSLMTYLHTYFAMRTEWARMGCRSLLRSGMLFSRRHRNKTCGMFKISSLRLIKCSVLGKIVALITAACFSAYGDLSTAGISHQVAAPAGRRIIMGRPAARRNRSRRLAAAASQPAVY
jgi:hypothetical protein